MATDAAAVAELIAHPERAVVVHGGFLDQQTPLTDILATATAAARQQARREALWEASELINDWGGHASGAEAYLRSVALGEIDPYDYMSAEQRRESDQTMLATFRDALAQQEPDHAG